MPILSPKLCPGVVWERISWSKPKPWQCLFYLIAEVIWVLVPGNTAWSRFQIISGRNAPLCCETCPGGISPWQSSAAAPGPSEVGRHEAAGLTTSSGLLASSKQRDDVSSKGDMSAPSRAQEDDDFSKARVMCGHVNSMICRPELAGIRCGQETATACHAVRLGPTRQGRLEVCTLSQPTGLRRVKFTNAPGRVKSCSWLCRAGKERKKEDRYALDCQERAYWLVNRTPVSRGCWHVALVPQWCPPCRPLGQSPSCSGHSCGHSL